MFIKLTSYYGNVYININEIRSFSKEKVGGKTIIRFIRDDSDVVCVKESPDEIMQKINEMRGNKND